MSDESLVFELCSMQINEKKSEYQRKRKEDKSMGNYYSAASDPHETKTITIATASATSTSTTTTTVATVYLTPLSETTPQNEQTNKQNKKPKH